MTLEKQTRRRAAKHRTGGGARVGAEHRLVAGEFHLVVFEMGFLIVTGKQSDDFHDHSLNDELSICAYVAIQRNLLLVDRLSAFLIGIVAEDQCSVTAYDDP